MTRPGAALALAIPLVLTGACGDDGGGDGSTSVASAADDFAPPTTTVSDASTSSPDDTAADSTTGPAGVPCSSNSDCTSAEYCRWPDYSCGASGMDGVCTSRDEACDPTDARPVCGCDGAVHATPCLAQDAGVDVNFLGGCETPNGAFDCGFSYCITGEEYCAENGGPMPSFECVVLPPVCQPPDCSCITTCCDCDNATCCSQYCSNVNDALTYTCPG